MAQNDDYTLQPLFYAYLSADAMKSYSMPFRFIRCRRAQILASLIEHDSYAAWPFSALASRAYFISCSRRAAIFDAMRRIMPHLLLATAPRHARHAAFHATAKMFT